MVLENEGPESNPEGLDHVKKNTETLGTAAEPNVIKIEVNGGSEHKENTSIPGVQTENETPAKAIGIEADPLAAKGNGGEIGVDHFGESSSNLIGSAASEGDSSNTTPSKGHGLKKWRRIRRDSSKDASAAADPNLMLKRRHSLPESKKNRDGNKQKSHEVEGEGSVASADSRFAAGLPVSEEVVSGGFDPEIELLVANSRFSVGADSDNSEERSSKSSTAASAPRLRHEFIGFGRDRSRARGPGGRGSGHAIQQRSQRGRGSVLDTGKKFRGDRLKAEKENSLSSCESDLRSSNAACVRWGSAVSSNGKQSERSVNGDDGGLSDEGQTFEEVRSGYYQDNGRAGGSSRENLDVDPVEEENNGESEISRVQTEIDPFFESAILLQAAQEALEKEIQKIEEIGKEPILEDSNFQNEERSSSPALDSQYLESPQRIEHLQCKLEEASATIKAKESRIHELEGTVRRTSFSNTVTGSTDMLPLEDDRACLELEFEGLFKKRIESEIEYFITAEASRSCRVSAGDQSALFDAQKSLAVDQTRIMLSLQKAENKAVVLEEKAKELEARCQQLLAAEEVLKLHNKVCKLSLSCFVQLVVLCLALWWFLLQLLPPSGGFVPT